MKKKIFSLVLSIITTTVVTLTSVTANFTEDNYAIDLSNANSIEINTISDSSSEIQSYNVDNAQDLFTTDVPSTELQEIDINSVDNSNLANLNAKTSILTANMGTNPCNTFSTSLTNNSMHILEFTLNKDTIIYSKFESLDSNYLVALCKQDSTGSMNYITNAFTPNSNLNYILESGTYGFVIMNNGGTYDKQYAIRVNASSPSLSNSTGFGVYQLSSSYDSIISYNNFSNYEKEVYYNGKTIMDINKQADLDWKRIQNITWSGGWNYNEHSISNVEIGAISNVGKYTSDYVNSNNAVIIQLAPETLYMFNESISSAYNRVYHFIDPFNNLTPRRLTAYDVSRYQCWLIYDIDKGVPIDFWSSLNYNYIKGTESASFVAY